MSENSFSVRKPVAEERYEEKEKEIRSLLNQLKTKLKKHKGMFMRDPINFGYVADLERIVVTLREIEKWIT